MYTKEYTNIKASTKGALVVDLLASCDEQGMSRKEIAESVGCTVARVGEVVRALKDAVRLVEGSSTHYIVADASLLPERTDRRSNSEVKAETSETEVEAEAPKAKRTRVKAEA